MMHVVDGGRASWSSLAALASLQQSDHQTDVAMTAVALGGESGHHRAKQAGITLEDTDVSLRKRLRHADVAVAWDGLARASIAKLAPNLRTIEPPTPTPPKFQLLDASLQHEIRSQLDISPDLPVVAFLSDSFDANGQFIFASLLVAASLAGFPAVGVAMDGALDDKTLDVMSRIGRGSTLVIRQIPPWSLLPACDCAVALEPIEDAGPILADLAQWAAAAGTNVLAPALHQTAQDTDSFLRFTLAKQILAALKSRPDPHASTRIAAHRHDAAYDRWLEEFLAQLHDASNHSGAP